MSLRSNFRKLGDSSGQNLVEYALSALLLVILMLSVFEIGRMVLVYTTVANAARVGVRYAEVHGSDNSVTQSQVKSAVKQYLNAAPMDTASANLHIDVTGVGGSIGSMVTVTVNYKYDPFMRYFPSLGVYLASTSQGVITF